ncbi:MAG: Lrp/AsnC family transcriptional regulator [Pseudomonadota bacterium]
MQESRTQIDRTDRALLAALQRDAHLTAEELGKLLNLSASQAGRRRQRLEQNGFIRGYGARLEPAAIGLGVQAFVQVQMERHEPEATAVFTRKVKEQPEVVSVWVLTGEADYMLRVWCTDLAALNHLIHQVILPHSGVARVQSQIVMDQPKTDAALPL